MSVDLYVYSLHNCEHISLHTVKVRDLISWMHDMITLFTVDEQAKNVSQAESMIAKHNEHKVIICEHLLLCVFCVHTYVHKLWTSP